MEIIEEASIIIAEFLSRHGGRSNGYDTKVEGIIGINSQSSIHLLVPASTFSYRKKLSNDLALKLLKFLIDNDVKDAVNIRSAYTGMGCYTTLVGITIESVVRL